jgi:hypothetical protein
MIISLSKCGADLPVPLLPFRYPQSLVAIGDAGHVVKIGLLAEFDRTAITAARRSFSASGFDRPGGEKFA